VAGIGNLNTASRQMTDLQAPAQAAPKLGRQAWRFAVSGVLGLVVDTAVLYGLMALGLPFAVARVLSFLAAATFTWVFNRRLTFDTGQPTPPSWREWLTYLAAMAVGGVVNYGVSLGAYHGFALVRAYPVLALVLGSAAGMTLNFLSARRLLLRATK
jgi:putative flippase GtrA